MSYAYFNELVGRKPIATKYYAEPSPSPDAALMQQKMEALKSDRSDVIKDYYSLYNLWSKQQNLKKRTSLSDLQNMKNVEETKLKMLQDSLNKIDGKIFEYQDNEAGIKKGIEDYNVKRQKFIDDLTEFNNTYGFIPTF